MKTTRRALLIVLLTAIMAPVALAASTTGKVNRANHTTGNGRMLEPVGALSNVGNFPTGAAITPDGRFAWIVDSGHGRNDVQILEIATGKVVQSLPLPGAFGGVAITPDGRKAFVSGSPSAGKDTDNGTVKGSEGDVVHVFTIDPSTGLATENDPISLPSESGGTGQINSLPPTSALYPAGVAVSPDGKWVGVALQQADKVDVFPVAGGAVTAVSVGAYPTDVVFDRKNRLWVSNLYDGSLSVVDPASASVVGTVTGLGGAAGDFNAQPEGMALDPLDDRLYVAVTQRDTVDAVDTSTLKVLKSVSVGREGAPLGVEPVAVAPTPDGRTLFVADANEDTVAAIALRDRPASAGAATRPHRVWVRPTRAALLAYAKATRAERARHRRAKRRAHGAAARRREARRHARVTDRLVHRVNGHPRNACTGPSRTAIQRYRRAALRALRTHDKKAFKHANAALPAIKACPAAPGYVAGLRAYDLIGKIPTAAYPDAVAMTPKGDRLLWVAGKGFGATPNTLYAFDGDKRAGGKVTTTVYGQYVLDALDGIVGRLATPTDKYVKSKTAQAIAQAVPVNTEEPPANTPVREGGPIKHVFVIVRENRTYDQIFGSDPRGDGDPSLELFDDNGVPAPIGGITPNAHALTQKFPLLDHFYSDSEVSVDGHLITAGTIANDYVQKATAQNYSRPGKSYDFGIAPISFGPNDFIFDQAVKQSISFTNYGEEAAGLSPMGSANRPTYQQVVANSNVAYPGPVQIGCLAATGPPGNLAGCFEDSGMVGTTGTVTAATSRVNIFNAQFNSQLASGSVPAFNYLIVPNDHTNGTTSGAYSSQALIADNDLALGQIVQIISHSSIWDSSAIFVEEDDSQDGADHVDAHRQPGFVISPWSKRGVEVPTRYDQYSIMATVEKILGLKPLSINDALATPMYDAFVSGAEKPDVEGTRYTAIQPTQSLTEVNSSSTPMAALSRALPWDELDLVPQAVSDEIMYAAVHGSLAGFSGPGPDASPAEHARALGALRAIAAGDSARDWLRSHGGDVEDDDEGGAAVRRAEDDPYSRPISAAIRATAAAQARGALAALGAGSG